MTRGFTTRGFMARGFMAHGFMAHGPLPRGVRKAVECLEAEPGRSWRLAELARASGIAPRTLQKQFRRFVGRAPLAFLCELRFARVREELVHGRDTGVTAIAMRYGFAHLGRFAVAYRRRYGESPSKTLRRPCAHEPRAGLGSAGMRA